MMKELVTISILLLLAACEHGPRNNYLLYEVNGFEVFHSRPIDSVFVTEGRVYVPLEAQDMEALVAVANQFRDERMVTVYIGGKVYSELSIDFRDPEAFLAEGPISLPEIEGKMNLFRESGIRVKR